LLSNQTPEREFKMIIPILGCPGSGKTTIINRLIQDFGCPGFELSWMPEFRYMNGKWIDYAVDEQIAVRAMAKVAIEYSRAGHSRVFISDFRTEVVSMLLEELSDQDVRVLVLVFSDESLIRARVLDPQRPSGYRNVDEAVKANRWFLAQTISGASQIDVAAADVDAVIGRIAVAYGLPNKPLERTC
jgi:cytidylate kinase